MNFLQNNFLKQNKSLLFILVVTLFIFWPVTQGDILPLIDDYPQILQNPNVTNFSFQSIKNHFTSFVLHSYQPLASFSYSIEYFLVGKKPFLYHFNNLMLHLINIVLVYVILLKILKNKLRPVVLVTIFFAIHPLQTETIGWLSTRSTLLFSLFLLASCYQYLKYLESHTNNTKPFILSFLFALLAMLSKSMAIILPFIIIGLDYLYLRNLTLKAILDKSVFFGLSICFGLVSLFSREAVGGSSEMKLITDRGLVPYTFFEKIAVSAYSILFYIKKFIFPVDLHSVYGYPLKIHEDQLPLKFRLAPFIVLLLVALAVVIYLKSSKEYKRFLVFGILLFSVSIGLTLNVFNFLAQMTAERYMYLGLIGLAIPLVLFLEKLFANKKFTHNVYIFYTVVFLLFAFKSHSQAKIWKNLDTYLNNVLEAFEQNDLRDNSSNLVIYELGIRHIHKKEFKKAILCFDRSIKMDKNSSKVYAARGVAYSSIGNQKQALKDFNAVINTPKLREKKDVLSNVFRFKGQLYKSNKLYKKSKIAFDSAVYFDPNNIPAQRELIQINLLLKKDNSK